MRDRDRQLIYELIWLMMLVIVCLWGGTMMIKMLRDLVKQANGFGAQLRIYRPKSHKYECCITGQDTYGRRIRMGGTAEWLYDELLRSMTRDRKEIER